VIIIVVKMKLKIMKLMKEKVVIEKVDIIQLPLENGINTVIKLKRNLAGDTSQQYGLLLIQKQEIKLHLK